jgi:DNA-binding HxlR family transcriptional regulator
MVRRVAYSERPPRARYELTDLGRDFIPTLRALADFGNRNLARPAGTTPGMADGREPLQQP